MAKNILMVLVSLTAIVGTGCTYNPLASFRKPTAEERQADNSGYDWSFSWGWKNKVNEAGEPMSDNPEYDAAGNLIVSEKVVKYYKFPDCHWGPVYDIKNKSMSIATEMEVATFGTPIGPIESGALVSTDVLAGHISHRFLKVFELETGVWYGYNYREENWTYGVDLLALRF